MYRFCEGNDVGYLFGLPVREYLLAGLTLPFTIFCVVQGELPVLKVVQLYLVVCHRLDLLFDLMPIRIERLPDGPRETLILREVEGLSYAEIAKTQSIPKGTVMSRLHYARKQLQSHLIEMGIATGAGAQAEE